MYSYFAYGLGIHSDLPLPELSPGTGDKDIVIQICKLDNISLPATSVQPYLKINPNEIILSIDQVGTFVIKDGIEINIDPAKNVDERLLRRYIIGTVMAFLLYQRGLLVLHASSLNINGFAVAFLGNPGSGKSSIAAAFYKFGHEIITDDVSAIGYSNNELIVFPGYPQIKLSDDISRTLGFDIDTSIKLDEHEEKRGYRINFNLFGTPLILRQIYILTEASDQYIERITPQQSVKEIIRHSYPTRFAQPGNQGHFQNCVELANKIPLFRLYRTSSLNDLPLLVKLVEDNQI